MTIAVAPDQTDPCSPLVRLAKLLDDDDTQPLHDADDSGVLAVRGRVHGAPVVAFCTDAARMGGAMGTSGCEHIAAAIDLAVDERVPVLGLWHSGGARLNEGIGALEAVGTVFAAMVRASGKILQLSVVLGPAAGGAAYGPALTDIVVMSDAGRVFVTGPDVVRKVTGEDATMEELGGPGAHGPKSGVVHVITPTEDEAIAQARAITSLVTDQRQFDADTIGDAVDVSQLLPTTRVRAYDVHPLIDALMDDEPAFVELQPTWARNVVVGLGRLADRTVGVVANNPLRKGGCLDSLSAEKAARFVRMCDSFGIPLLVLVDVPGYLPGLDQEWSGVVRRGAKLLHAFAEAVVPRVTLVTRKSFGGAYIAMNSNALGATAVYAWPDAEVAVMSAEAAVGVLHRRKIAAADEYGRAELVGQLVDEHLREISGLHKGVEMGAIDEVIEPAKSRQKAIEALLSGPERRGFHGNIPL